MNQELNHASPSHPHADWSRFNLRRPEDLKQAIDAYQAELLADPGAMKPATPEQMDALMKRFPYLQLFHDYGDFEQEHEVALVQVKTGWVICDYFYALSSSLGQRTYVVDAGARTVPSSEGGDADEGGSGTVVLQAYETARLMVGIARERGWKSVRTVDGCDLMKWASWVAAEEYGIPFAGYEPDDAARAKRERLRRDADDLANICRQLHQGGSHR